MAAVHKIISIGNSAGVVLPKETMERQHLQTGDPVRFSETPEGILVSPYDDEFAAKMEVASDILRRYRNAFKKLAE